MKLTVKTTQQKVFNIDAEISESIGAIKAKIEQYQGFAAGSQKIIYSGKILADDKTLESCGFKEKDFLVLMVSKPKPTPSPMPATSSSTPVPAPAPAVAAPPIEAPAPAAATPPPALTAPAEPAAAGSSFLSGAQLQTSIQSMVDMGFERDQVMRALRASFNNPERAVEYLMTGIPSHLEAEAAGTAPAAPRTPAAATAAPPATPAAAPATAPAAAPPSTGPQNLFQLAQQQQQQGTPGTGLGAGLGGAGAAGGPQLDLAALANTPQMQQLREHLASNPEAIQPLLQSLAVQNPALAQALAANPEMLMQMLGGEFEGEDGDLPPGAQVINVTEEERAAIERLEALGFPRQAVIEAYFACDKNEELAANYLFEGND